MVVATGAVKVKLTVMVPDAVLLAPQLVQVPAGFAVNKSVALLGRLGWYGVVR